MVAQIHLALDIWQQKGRVKWLRRSVCDTSDLYIRGTEVGLSLELVTHGELCYRHTR
jgi:hypothetical protein